MLHDGCARSLLRDECKEVKFGLFSRGLHAVMQYFDTSARSLLASRAAQPDLPYIVRASVARRDFLYPAVPVRLLCDWHDLMSMPLARLAPAVWCCLMYGNAAEIILYIERF